MIQLNATPGLFDPPAQTEKKELPDDKSEHIKDTMILRQSRMISANSLTTHLQGC